MGDSALSLVQYGLETVNGTAVAADTKLACTLSPISPDRTIELIEENIGVRAKGMRVREGDVIAVTDTLTFDHAYYQALPVLLSCGLKGNITPVLQTTGQGDYLWTFSPSMTATNSIDSLTLELYDGVDNIERAYTMFEGYRIQFDIPQQQSSAPFVVEGQYFSDQNVKSSVTGGIALPTTENINAKVVRFYRDTAWAGVGGTAVTGMLRAGDIQIMTGVHPKFHGQAKKYLDTHAENTIHFIANFTFEGNADADNIYDLAQAATFSVVRLSVSGAQIGSGSNHNFTLDMGGFWKEPVKISEVANGNNLFSCILEGKYDITGAKVLEASVLTNVSAI